MNVSKHAVVTQVREVLPKVTKILLAATAQEMMKGLMAGAVLLYFMIVPSHRGVLLVYVGFPILYFIIIRD